MPASMAAFAIGPMTRAIDMGDVHEIAAHTSEYVFPALLGAMGLRESVTGKEFITAFVVGEEVILRVGEAFREVEINTKGVGSGYAIFGPVAAVGKLLELNLEELKNAMGMAVGMTQPHNMLLYSQACHMPRVHHGFIAQDSINICLLAKRGVTGPHNIMLGPRGYSRMFDRVIGDPDKLTLDLGLDWRFLSTMMKPYPSCKCTHAACDGIIALMDEHDFGAKDIDRIEVDVSSINYAIACEPKELKWNPMTTPECQFSLPYTMAVAALDGRVFLDSYTQEVKTRKDVRELMTKIAASEEKKLLPFSSRVNVILNDGRKVIKEVQIVKGHPKNPFTLEELVAKFKQMIPYSAYHIPEETVNSIIERILKLEKIDDVVEALIVPLTPYR